MKRMFLVSALFGTPSAAWAASPEPPAAEAAPDVTVETRLSPEPSNVGDLLAYEIIVAFPQGVTVNLPTQLDLAPLHLVETADAPVEATGASLRKTFTLSLQHFAVGEANVPAFDLTTVDAQGAVQTVRVPPHPFTVDALLANEADPVRRGEDPPVSIDYPNDTAETAIYGTLGGAVLGLLLWGLVRRIMRKPAVVPAPPSIPPHELAMSALEELEQGDLMRNDDLVPFYLQLTEIAKGYLEGRFGVPSLDRTTEEIRRDLLRQKDAIAPLSADEVVAFLQRCDLVKFARMAPEADEASGALGEVRSMVEQTLPTVLPTPEAAPTSEPAASTASEEDA